MAANDSLSQQALANDPTFRRRFKASLGKIAWQILNEDPNTTNHLTRKNYALQVIANLDQYVNTLIGSFVMRPNVFGFQTSAALDNGVAVVTTLSGDPDMDSQLATDWSLLSGV